MLYGIRHLRITNITMSGAETRMVKWICNKSMTELEIKILTKKG